MGRTHIELEIGEIVVDSRLRMTQARLEQAIIEQLHEMLAAAGPDGFVQDSRGEIYIDSLNIRASNALTPGRIGEQIAGELVSPLADPDHPLREPPPGHYLKNPLPGPPMSTPTSKKGHSK